jgi:hypothetical protein
MKVRTFSAGPNLSVDYNTRVVLTTVLLRIHVFCDVTLCDWACVSRCFEIFLVNYPPRTQHRIAEYLNIYKTCLSRHQYEDEGNDQLQELPTSGLKDSSVTAARTGCVLGSYLDRKWNINNFIIATLLCGFATQKFDMISFINFGIRRTGEISASSYNSNKSPTRCNIFPVYYPDVYL